MNGFPMDGFLNVLKPPGMTSHDVVGYVRRLSGMRKIGHTGTLDPGAAGVLPLALGRATRVIQFLKDEKEYRAEITFGVKTTTGDSFGEVEYSSDASGISSEHVQAVIKEFLGEIEQVPPMTSAVRHQGKKLYELARMGQVVERKPRRVVIHSLRLGHSNGWGTPRPRALIDVACSAGTYIRSLCTDIGDRLGCGAHMSFLVRTRAGIWGIDTTCSLEELAERNSALDKFIINMDLALAHIPEVIVKEAAVPSVKAGNRLYSPGVDVSPGNLIAGQLVRLHSEECLLAIARAEYDTGNNKLQLQPVRVLAN